MGAVSAELTEKHEELKQAEFQLSQSCEMFERANNAF